MVVIRRMLGFLFYEYAELMDFVSSEPPPFIPLEGEFL